MTTHTATTLLFVRTANSGVVKVDVGERVPNDALPDEVSRLAARGAIDSSDQDSHGTDDDQQVEDVAPKPGSRRRRTRGQPGPNLEDSAQ